MKKSLIAALATSSIFFMACGDDGNPSSAGGNSGSNDDSIVTTASLFVDEDEHLLALTPDNLYEKQCVVGLDTTLSWKDVKKLTGSSVSKKYEFRGDTLVIYDYVDGHQDEFGEMFVGGTADNIYGTWQSTFCDYNRNEQTTACHEIERRYIDRTFKFSKGKFTANLDYHFDKYIEELTAEGYMKSYFMYLLYRGLSGGYVESEPTAILRAEEYIVEGAIKDYGVSISSSTKTDQTFTIGEKTYTITIQKADISFNVQEFSSSYDIAISVTDGNKTCNLNYKKMFVTKELCKVENVDKLSIDNDEDADGNEYFHAYLYRDHNNDEFEECIASIAAKSEEDP